LLRLGILLPIGHLYPSFFFFFYFPFHGDHCSILSSELRHLVFLRSWRLIPHPSWRLAVCRSWRLFLAELEALSSELKALPRLGYKCCSWPFSNPFVRMDEPSARQS
jgi:hypothetical protein